MPSEAIDGVHAKRTTKSGARTVLVRPQIDLTAELNNETAEVYLLCTCS